MPLNASSIGLKSQPYVYEYDYRDAILYALGVGAKAEEIDYLLESRGPKILPTFGVIPGLRPNVEVALKLDIANPYRALHGEHEIIKLKPIGPSGVLTSVAAISAIYDKGKGALVVVEVSTVDEVGDEVFRNTASIYCLDEGGFGGPPQPKSAWAETAPDGPPDFEVDEKTTDEQALLYRLSGDVNPLHADPEVAAKVGYPKPILQGQCAFGFAGRALLNRICLGDESRFTSIGARFSKPVLPGDSLITRGWRVGPGRVSFTTVTQNGDEVLSRGTFVHRE